MLTDGWIKEMWYVYNTEHYFIIKNKEIMWFAEKYVELEITGKQNKPDSVKYHVSSYMRKI